MENKKRIPKYLILGALAAANVLAGIGMLLCAYSVYFPPQVYPKMAELGLAFPAFLLVCILFLVFWLFAKRLYMLISAGFLLACIGTIRTYCPLNVPFPVPDNAVKVMSYNLWNIPGINVETDDEAEWAAHPILNYLTAAQADIVCCQEALRMDYPAIDALLARAYPYRQYNWVRNSLMACLSKWPILSVDTIDYASCSNVSLAYRIRVNADTLLVVNNHFESYHLNDSDKYEYKELIKNPEDVHVRGSVKGLRRKIVRAAVMRAPQADSVARYLETAPEKYIIACGDFNDPSVSYVHYRLTRFLNDAYTRSGNGPGISYHRSGMYFRIDNILCSPNIKAHKSVVDTSISMSDHYPICAWLTLGRQDR